jgi:hypothetical protein
MSYLFGYRSVQRGATMPPTPELVDTARRLVGDLVASKNTKSKYFSFEQIESLPATAAILEADEQTRIAVTREYIDRIGRMADRLGPLRGQEHRYMNLYHEDGFPWEARLLVPRLLRRKLPWASEDLAFLLNRLADLGLVSTFNLPFLPQLANVVQRWLATSPLTEELRTGLVRLGKAVEWCRSRAAERRLCEQLTALARNPRDTCRDPSRLVTFPLAWRTDTALALARHMYESQDFSAMPILADALQDAGCDNADILDHCRGPGPHVRGCWCVDLLLGKQ